MPLKTPKPSVAHPSKVRRVVLLRRTHSRSQVYGNSQARQVPAFTAGARVWRSLLAYLTDCDVDAPEDSQTVRCTPFKNQARDPPSSNTLALPDLTATPKRGRFPAFTPGARVWRSLLAKMTDCDVGAPENSPPSVAHPSKVRRVVLLRRTHSRPQI